MQMEKSQGMNVNVKGFVDFNNILLLQYFSLSYKSVW